MNNQQLTLQQIDVWLTRIETHVQEIETSAALSDEEQGAARLNPGEAAQAIARYGALFVRLTQLRQQFTRGGNDAKEQAMVEALLGIKRELMLEDEEDMDRSIEK